MAVLFESHRITVGAGALRVLTAGSGEPLVYLHGVGDAGEPFPALASLAERYRVVRPDHPGFIESDDLGALSARDIAAVELQLLDDLGIGSFVLIGCSFGGWVAAELALLASDRVSRLLLIDAVGLAGPEPSLNIFEADPVTVLKATTYSDERRALALAAPPAEPIATRLARSRARAQLVAGDPYMHDPTLAARLSDLTVDTTVIWGAHDGVVPPSYARQWTRAISTAHLEIIDEAGHLPHIEQPERFLAVTGLLDAAAATSTGE